MSNKKITESSSLLLYISRINNTPWRINFAYIGKPNHLNYFPTVSPKKSNRFSHIWYTHTTCLLACTTDMNPRHSNSYRTLYWRWKSEMTIHVVNQDKEAVADIKRKLFALPKASGLLVSIVKKVNIKDIIKCTLFSPKTSLSSKLWHNFL